VAVLEQLLTPAKRRQAERVYADKTPVTEIAAVLGVERATVYRSLTPRRGWRQRCRAGVWRDEPRLVSAVGPGGVSPSA
jgi:IS30 family transposase